MIKGNGPGSTEGLLIRGGSNPELPDNNKHNSTPQRRHTETVRLIIIHTLLPEPVRPPARRATLRDLPAVTNQAQARDGRAAVTGQLMCILS